MENNGKTGDMAANFKVPDTYGVYQFKVNYHTVGLTTDQAISLYPYLFIYLFVHTLTKRS